MAGVRRNLAKAKPKVRTRNLKRPAADADPGDERSSQDFTDISKVSITDFEVGKDIVAKIWYGGEEGLLQGKVKEIVTDHEGPWVGVGVTGTQIHQLRTYLITTPKPDATLYLSLKDVAPEARIRGAGMGYLLEYRPLLVSDRYPWADNCQDQLEAQDENPGLREAALAAGLHPQVEGPPLPAQEIGGDPGKPVKGKKPKGRQKVKQMIEDARWNWKGTPLDPQFKKPISLKMKKKDSSSSSASSGGSTSDISSEEGLGSEHKLRAISKRLPGYLCRTAAKEARRNLAEASGENLASLRIFHRYYRQVVAPRGGSKGMQREMLTLSVALDTLLEGNILGAADIMAQRLKSLEMMQQGAEANLALQIELLPKDHLGMVADNEARYAQKQYSAESKLQKQLKGNSQPGKGNWAGGLREAPAPGIKGKRKGPEKGKGKEKGVKGHAESSKVVTPQT